MGHFHAALCLVIGTPQGEEWDGDETEKTVEEIMTDNFPKLMKTVSTQIQETQQILSMMKTTPKPVIKRKF